MSDESAVVYVCVMDDVHWHLYPPVNLWANAVLVSVAKNAAEIHERTAYGHERLGRQRLRHDVGQHRSAVDPHKLDEPVRHLLL